MKIYFSYIVLWLSVEYGQAAYSNSHLFFPTLDKSECTNMDEVLEKLDWPEMKENPYVLNPYNVDISKDKQCYIIIKN